MYYIFLCCVFAAIWARSAIDPSYPHDWLLENYLVFATLPVMFATYKWFRLSKVSYTCITIFMILHVIGSHYTYAEVPFGGYVTSFSNNIDGFFATLFGGDRNSYDRLVHFSFGLLFAYPVREIFLRMVRVKGFRGYFLPVAIMWMFGAMYEIIEWGAAANIDAAAGSVFLGSQGDIWDAQKDMILAGIGGFITMLIVLIINAIYQKQFSQEMIESLEVSDNDQPLGENTLEQMMH